MHGCGSLEPAKRFKHIPIIQIYHAFLRIANKLKWTRNWHPVSTLLHDTTNYSVLHRLYPWCNMTNPLALIHSLTKIFTTVKSLGIHSFSKCFSKTNLIRWIYLTRKLFSWVLKLYCGINMIFSVIKQIYKKTKKSLWPANKHHCLFSVLSNLYSK